MQARDFEACVSRLIGYNDRPPVIGWPVGCCGVHQTQKKTHPTQQKTKTRRLVGLSVDGKGICRTQTALTWTALTPTFSFFASVQMDPKGVAPW
jgi:hypothetical protein